MSLADIEHLPKIVTGIDGLRDVLLAIDPEIITLREDVEELKKELYVKTTEKFILRWERDFGLPYDASLNLAQRRQRILNKLARKRTLNWENLNKLIESNLAENTQFYVVNKSAEYYFNIMVGSEEWTEMENAVRQAKPAYIICNIVNVSQYFRACGTFYCGTNPL